MKYSLKLPGWPANPVLDIPNELADICQYRRLAAKLVEKYERTHFPSLLPNTRVVVFFYPDEPGNIIWSGVVEKVVQVRYKTLRKDCR